MELLAAPGLVLTAYTAEPATPSADNLALLASWAATEVARTYPAADDADGQVGARDTSASD